MDRRGFYECQVRLIKDEETGQIVAEVPCLDVADYGPDTQEALGRLERLIAFHLECLLAESKPIPREKKPPRVSICVSGARPVYLRPIRVREVVR